jgi:hypothetical protein
MMKEQNRRSGGGPSSSSSSSSSSSRSLGSTAARALLLLPLGLAFFALLLQVRGWIDEKEECERERERERESSVCFELKKKRWSKNEKNSTSLDLDLDLDLDLFSLLLLLLHHQNSSVDLALALARPQRVYRSRRRGRANVSGVLFVQFSFFHHRPAFFFLFFSSLTFQPKIKNQNQNRSRPASASSAKASRAVRAGAADGVASSKTTTTTEKITASSSKPKKSAAANDNYVPKNPAVREDWALADGGWRPASFADLESSSSSSSTLPKLAFITTTAESYDQIRLWYEYHRSVGVSNFYLFVDGAAATPQVSARLRRLPGVVVVPRDDDLKARHASSRVWNETWLSAFFHKPCNHELFVLQSLNMEVGIALAERDGVDWLLHIDTDELMYPGSGPEFSLQTVLAAYPASVDTVVFPNYEALPERDDVSAPFDQVTLFKRNYHHVVSDAYFRSYHAVARGNPNYFITYGNGKSAARVRPGLRPNGAHRWYSYSRAPREETSDQSAVLHYTYDRFDDLKSRRDRCDCAPTEDDAKRCFILPFDRMAFLAASMKTDAELLKWFRERLVWNDPAVVTDLLKSGLFVRLFAPQMFMRGAEAALASGLGVSGPPDDAAAEAAAVAAAVADPNNPRWGSKAVLKGTRGSIAEEDLARAAAAGAVNAATGAAKAAGAAGAGAGRRRR